MAISTVRPIRVEGNIAYIPLTKGYEAIIDAADVSLVERWNWAARVKPNAVYAFRTSQRNGKKSDIKLHRFILSAPADLDVDHINGNGLDNRRENIRLATPSENMRNRGPNCRNTSGFKGVSFHKLTAKWESRIWSEGKQVVLGYFDTPELAHDAYVEAARRYHGAFAKAS